MNLDKLQLLKKHGQLLKNNLHGIEREALRVDLKGKIAQTKHPKLLGSALTHPYITTDYSEALLEFVTPAYQSIDESLSFLRKTHQFCMSNLPQDEFLWMSSMPCITPDIDHIPIAQYGTSNTAKMKEIYRLGLGIRYGRPMQTISGIHYNYSYDIQLMNIFSDNTGLSVSDLYLGLVRNFRRLSWVLLYFLGASPALCKSFIQNDQREDLKVHQDSTLYLPYATSLRMSDIGYQNNVQALLPISLNSMEEYISSLISATQTTYGPYEELGLKDKHGQYHQLNTNILQIENEYYAPIRPKQPIKSGEKPSTALKTRGISYVEVRCIDINPYSEMGIHKVQTKLTDLLLSYCLLLDSPKICDNEFQIIQRNTTKTARNGRAPDFIIEQLNQAGKPIKEVLNTLMIDLKEIADIYDDNIIPDDETFLSYNDALSYYQDTLIHQEELPSEKILNTILQQKLSYIDYAKLLSSKHRRTLLKSHPMADKFIDEFKLLSQQSVQEQHDIESNDSLDFEKYLENYHRAGLK